MRLRRARAAFTLLEVLVGLFLAGLVVAGLTLAVDLHVRVVDVSRTEIEQTQLTRALLAQMAADLRNAGQPRPNELDFSRYKFPKIGTSRTSGAGTAGSAGGAGSLAAGGGSGDSSAGSSGSSNTASGATTSATGTESTQDFTGDLLALTELPPKPGVYGNLNQLMIDHHRLPRSDQLQAMLQATADAPLTAPPTNPKNVTYYLDSGGGSDGGGLMRRSWDRPTAGYAVQQGQGLDTEAGETRLAAEVVGLEFHYFDGSQWVDTWDTNLRQAIPMAVEIVLAIARPGTSTGVAAGASLTDLAAADNNIRVHRLTVTLPTGQPSTDQGTGTGTTTTTTTTSGTEQPVQ